MNKQTTPLRHTENDNDKRGNPETPHEVPHSSNKRTSYFRDNLEKQKEETKKHIEEKMKNTLKNSENNPTFFKENPPKNSRITHSGKDHPDE